MAPFFIPAPCIIPLRDPVICGTRTIDTCTKIEFLCETYLDCEMFYTLDGTKPQPYAGIVQGSKLHKYKSPFCLPSGKITIKAIAINSRIHTMRSSVVTKCFEVINKIDLPNTVLDETKINKRKSSRHKKKHNRNLKSHSEPLNANEPIVQNGGIDMEQRHPSPSDSINEFLVAVDGDCYENDSSSSQSACNSADLNKRLSISDEENVPEEDTSSVKEKDQSLDEDVPSILQFPVTSSRNCSAELKGSEVKANLTSDKVNLEAQHCCANCEAAFQRCSSCSALNAATSKYCIYCGDKLMITCTVCRNLNSVSATYCNYCGKKMDSDVPITYADSATMAEPLRKSVSIQGSLSMVCKHTQTASPQTPKSHKKLPPHSPGRGFWHQQLDYICNHLKTYAYNNTEFRQCISEPVLSEFRNAQVEKLSDSINITISFAPLSS